jgi:hypothetical protein
LIADRTFDAFVNGWEIMKIQPLIQDRDERAGLAEGRNRVPSSLPTSIPQQAERHAENLRLWNHLPLYALGI